VLSLIRKEIEAGGGWISFARYMELALHAPGLGYYAGGARKFGAQGDFVTAPELGRLFGRTLARQLREFPRVLELGAGTGALAETLLGELGCEYWILETSASAARSSPTRWSTPCPCMSSRGGTREFLKEEWDLKTENSSGRTVKRPEGYGTRRKTLRYQSRT
jgi:hypothetical protein